MEKKEWKGFLTTLTAVIKDSTTSIRNQANELKVHKKTVGTAIKQDLSPDRIPLDYAIRGVLET